MRFGAFEGILEDTSCRVCKENGSAQLVVKDKNGIGFYKCLQCNLMYALFTGLSGALEKFRGKSINPKKLLEQNEEF